MCAFKQNGQPFIKRTIVEVSLFQRLAASFKPVLGYWSGVYGDLVILLRVETESEPSLVLF